MCARCVLVRRGTDRQHPHYADSVILKKRRQGLYVMARGVWVPNIVSPHATWAYSWMRPPSRSRLKTLNVLGGVGQSLPFGGR